MEEVLGAVGAETVEWPYKTECCGAALSITRSDVVARLAHRLISMAREAGADCIVAACPLCQANLDLRQADASKAHGPLPATPIMYMTQVLGLALGLSDRELGLGALAVSAESLVASATTGGAA